MKSLGVGCIGTILGLFAGLVLAVGAFQLQQSGNAVYAAPSNAQADISVTVSAAYINSELQPVLRQSGLSQQTKVSLAAPNLVQFVTTVDVTVLGFPISANVTVPTRVTVRNGRIVLTVDRIDAGGVTVPQSLLGSAVGKMRAQAENEINQQAQRVLQGTGLQISNVRITPDDLTVDLLQQ